MTLANIPMYESIRPPVFKSKQQHDLTNKSSSVAIIAKNIKNDHDLFFKLCEFNWK